MSLVEMSNSWPRGCRLARRSGNRVVSKLLILLPLMMVLLPGLWAQETGAVHIGLPTDWSHRHMLFSAPGSPEQAASLFQDPRYVQQWLRRDIHPRIRPHRRIHRDWSANMG